MENKVVLPENLNFGMLLEGLLILSLLLVSCSTFGKIMYPFILISLVVCFVCSFRLLVTRQLYPIYQSIIVVALLQFIAIILYFIV